MATVDPPASRTRFEQSVRTFFRVEDMEVEWDMLATRALLDAELHQRSKGSLYRDRFFLLFRRGRNVTVDCWYKRFEEWDRHFDGYLAISGVPITPTTTSIPAHGSKRVDKLFEHLGVLDTKIGMAMTINSLILGLSYFLVTASSNLIAGAGFPKTGNWPELAWILKALMYLILSLTVVCGLFNIWHGLRAFRRVVWGDLQLFPEDPMQGERKQTDFLIVSLTRRTNLFRVVTNVTTLACKIGVWWAICAGVILVLKVIFFIPKMHAGS